MGTQKNPPVEICVRADKILGKQEHFWRYVGYDECNYTYMPEGEQLLRMFGGLKDAPYSIRTHFMFCTGNCRGAYKFGSTNLYTEDGQGNPVFDFTCYDRILDAQLQSGNKPFVELGFMPMDLADTSFGRNIRENWYDTYKNVGWTFPPKDYDRWHLLIETLAAHLLERYGEKEASSWDYELWNEPDIFYWSGSAAEYCKLYDYTEHALHSILPQARLSGPATTGPTAGSNSLKFLRAFLDHCRSGINYCTQKQGTRLDFITFHVKGGGFPFSVPARVKKENPSIESLLLQVKTGLDAVRDCGFGDREIVLSEADPDGWAAGGMYDNANMVFRNSEYYASYVACAYAGIERLSIEYGMKVRPLAWAWTFPGETCFEGTRAFTTQGIEKPVFHTFQLLSMMGSEKIVLESTGISADTKASPDISGIAAGDPSEPGSPLGILLYSHFEDRDAQSVTPVKLSLSGLAPGEVRVSRYSVDKNHSNGYEEWLRRGSPLYPSGEDYEAIRQSGLLAPPETEVFRVSENGTISLEWELPLHGVWFLSVKRA